MSIANFVGDHPSHVFVAGSHRLGTARTPGARAVPRYRFNVFEGRGTGRRESGPAGAADRQGAIVRTVEGTVMTGRIESGMDASAISSSIDPGGRRVELQPDNASGKMPPRGADLSSGA